MDLYKNWWMVALKGLLLLLFGLLAVTKPEDTIMTLVTFLGIVSLLGGILLLITSLSNTNKEGWGWILAEGIFDIVLGVIVLSYPFGSAVAAATIFSIFIGFWALIGGFSLIGNAFQVRKVEGSRWALMLAAGILSLLLGWLIISNPMENSIAMTVVVGIFTIIFGIGTIIGAFELKKMGKSISQ